LLKFTEYKCFQSLLKSVGVLVSTGMQWKVVPGLRSSCSECALCALQTSDASLVLHVWPCNNTLPSTALLYKILWTCWLFRL